MKMENGMMVKNLLMLKNGKYDEGEFIAATHDRNDNGQWDDAEKFTDIKNGKWDEGEEFTDVKNGKYDEGEKFTDTMKMENGMKVKNLLMLKMENMTKVKNSLTEMACGILIFENG